MGIPPESSYRTEVRRILDDFSHWDITPLNVSTTEISFFAQNASNSTTLLVYTFPVLVAVCSVLATIIVATIVGNVFVISAIVLEKSLRATSNYLILSLAVTDLMVAVLVMPISIVDEVNTQWVLSAAVCDMWVSFDVLCCTASILHLVAIALDRYWSVTNVDYTRKRSPTRILVMIVLVWLVSFSVSVPPLLGWRQPSNSSHNTSECVISQDLGYTIYSTFGAFYIPLTLILALNYKIYIVARTRFQNILEKRGVLRAALQAQRASVTMLVGGPDCAPSHGPDVTNCKSDTSILKHARSTGREGVAPAATVNTNLLDPKHCLVPGHRKPSSTHSDATSGFVEPSMIIQSEAPSSLRPPTVQLHTSTALSADTENPEPVFAEGYILVPSSEGEKPKSGGRIRRLMIPEIKKEKRTASVLGIITSAFIVCWLPFFIVALMRPFCRDVCHMPREFLSVILWLGYFNSMINPIIYTIFNPNFRVAFRKLYCARSKKIKFPHSTKQV